MTARQLGAPSRSWRQAFFSVGLIPRVLTGLVLLNLLVIGLAVWSVYQSRLKHDQSAVFEIRNLAQLLDQDVSVSMRSIDLALQVLVVEVEQQLVRGTLNTPTLDTLIKRLQFMEPDISGLRITDVQGRFTHGEGVQPTVEVSIADRDYFLQLRSQPGLGLVVSRPVVGRIQGKWVINLARPLRLADGSFAGVAVASVPLTRFTQAYAALATGPGSSFTLFDPELRIIVRSSGLPTDESMTGKKFKLKALEALLATGRSEGAYKFVSVVDGIERQFYYRQIKGFPLSISIGLATRDYLAEWRAVAYKTAGLVVIFIAVTMALFWLIRRGWRQQEATVGELNASNQTLVAEKNFNQAVFESSPFAMYVRDQKGIIKHLNPAAEKLFGWKKAQSIGRAVRSVPADKVNESEELRLRVMHGESILQFETQRLKRDGTRFDVSVTSTPLRHASGDIEDFLTIAIDISERKASEKQIEFLAYRDVLTGLPNRLLLLDRFQQAVAHAEHEGTQVALLVLDLDNFNAINDSLGHAMGDAMLQGVAERLLECVRESDTISRQGGDEFAIVLSDLRGPDTLLPVLQMMRERLELPFTLNGQEFITSACIGISFYPTDGKDFDTMLKKADTAMYRAKAEGRNHYRFFNGQMNIEAVEQLNLKNGLHQALERSEFELFYQPQIDLHSNALVGVEALIRWNHPEQGLISPARFIPLAESSELIVPIGNWAMHEACRQAVAWQAAGLAPMVMSVNLSAVQFRRSDVEQTVVQALQTSGLAARYLTLELTESVLVHDTDLVLATVQRLKRLGVTLSIDDFGTGYSSLSYLRRFDVDKLKIDQSFLRDLARNADDVAIVRAIIQMAHSLNLKTIAEGVETEDMAVQLRFFGCNEAQGEHFGRPMPAKALAEFATARAGSKTWQEG